VWGNSTRDHILKITHHKKKKWTGRVTQGEGPEFKPRYRKKKKKVYMTLRLCLTKPVVCPIGNVLTPLNYYKVSTDNSYKVLQGKYKTTSILKNVSWLTISTCHHHFFGIVCKRFRRIRTVMTKLK
jgi:hypothetical protein